MREQERCHATPHNSLRATLRQQMKTIGNKQTESHRGHVEHTLGDDKPDGKEEIRCWQERQNHECEALR